MHVSIILYITFQCAIAQCTHVSVELIELGTPHPAQIYIIVCITCEVCPLHFLRWVTTWGLNAMKNSDKTNGKIV